ncbi:Pentatricopeptide repeat-containing protein, mitochondrial, partial [Mucuna pruriens]
MACSFMLTAAAPHPIVSPYKTLGKERIYEKESRSTYGIQQGMQFLKLPRLLMPHVRRIHLQSQPLPSQSTYKFDSIDDAVALFHRMIDMHPLPSIVEFTKIVGMIAKMKYYATAINLYTLMESKGVVPFTVTFNILINCFCHMGQMGFAFSVMGKILKWGCQPNVVTFTTLMKGFCVNDKMLDALYIYDEMVAQRIRFDDVLYGTLINGLCKSKTGKRRAAIQLLQKMEGQLVKPNLVMYNTVVHGQRKEVTSLLNGYCLNNKVDEARELFNVMIVRVDGLCKSGGISDAWKLVDEMHHCGQPPPDNLVPDIVTYNILLDALCNGQQLDKAIALLIYQIVDQGKSEISLCCQDYFSEPGFQPEAHFILMLWVRPECGAFHSEGSNSVTGATAREVAAAALLFTAPANEEDPKVHLGKLGDDHSIWHDQSLSKVTSAATFYIIKVDTALDEKLEQIGSTEAFGLRGKGDGSTFRLLLPDNVIKILLGCDFQAVLVGLLDFLEKNSLKKIESMLIANIPSQYPADTLQFGPRPPAVAKQLYEYKTKAAKFVQLKKKIAENPNAFNFNI